MSFARSEGVSAIIYEQACAAEKRRRRKRGTLADPQRRVFINASVCEGCGDCSVKSNCVSVEPRATEFGRKRRIDQSSCNKDYSCVSGFCPSFVLVEGARVRKPSGSILDGLLRTAVPDPLVLVDSPFNALIVGVGGTGVVTIGALLAMAAHLEGKRATAFDMTGLAQKGGAVFSHLRIDAGAARPTTAALQTGAADVLLACDLVVGASSEALRTVEAERTRVIVNADVMPVSQFQRDRDFDFRTGALRKRMRQAVDARQYEEIDATGIAKRLFGDSIATNLLMTGFAFQAGLLPVSAVSIERAIELNGAAVELNRKAFRIGRLLRHDPARFADTPRHETTATVEADLDALIRNREIFLTEYQDVAHAARYRQRQSACSGACCLRERSFDCVGCTQLLQTACL